MRAQLPAISLVCLLAALAAGCGSLGGGSQLQNTVYDTHRRVANLDKNLEGSVNKLNETAAELLARVNDSDQQTKAVQSKLEENQVRLDALQKSLDEMRAALYRNFRISLGPGAPAGSAGGPSEVDAGNVQVVPPQSSAKPPADREGLDAMPPVSGASKTPAPAAAPSAGSAEADFHQAKESFAAGKYPAALDQFDAFLQRYPTSDDCAYAQFLKAKCLQNQEKYEDAVKEFEKVRGSYPTSAKVPLAMHQQAVCHARLGQTQRTKELFEEIIKNYPMSPAAEQAKIDLKKLK